MASVEECANQRDALLTKRLWVNELKSQYLEQAKAAAKELPVDGARLPSVIHRYTDHYADAYAQNQSAIVAYRAQAIFAERISGAAFIPSKSELKKLEMSVVEEERLLEQVQARLREKIQQANTKIDNEIQEYQRVVDLSCQNECLVSEIDQLEAELRSLSKELEEKERREKDTVEQQMRELQAVHNDLVREAAMRDDMRRERGRLEDKLRRLQSDEQKHRMSVEDSQEQQRLIERWVKSIAPVTGVKVESNTLVLTVGDGVGAMAGRRILVEFSSLGKVVSVRTDDGRTLPPVFNHSTLMRLLGD
ncbi:hypothetical protein GGI07_003723 [Coemansia sp. Benny D115]|nr:hypothetical protein GGI07_003723 [Coemansia sp. Benny D115]